MSHPRYRLPPWQQRVTDMLPLAATRPRRNLDQDVPAPAEFSEANLFAYSSRVRAAESRPPVVPQLLLGTWCVDRDEVLGDELYQLREYRIDDPILTFPEGRSHGRVVEKYIGWIRAGHIPQPGRAMQTAHGHISVCDGHHRAAALHATGTGTIHLWVSPVVHRPDTVDPAVVHIDGLPHRHAVATALAEGHPIPPEVLADYPDLTTQAHTPADVLVRVPTRHAQQDNLFDALSAAARAHSAPAHSGHSGQVSATREDIPAGTGVGLDDPLEPGSAAGM
ncbi:hypothetical protein ACQP2U_43120 (plasmid) [Nocardia sp. CA-084685]|uniref:hypothetical protein n=1 Tax=Nocardia sp. CA-084685 TaxID=3239970 RepID=UPI003D9644AF